jgi:hypothetical protein
VFYFIMIPDVCLALVIILSMDRTHRTYIATIVVMALLAFGLQIPWLGFFQDDWNFVFYSSIGGPQGVLEYLVVDGRPGATWVYALGFGLLGYEPALWQFFSLLLRVLTTITFWIILSDLWPRRTYGNLIAAIFFLAYPFFTLQPQSVSYAIHWMAYLLYGISVFLMMRAVQKPGNYLWYTIPAVIGACAHLLTIEYFVGLEILRPLLLWFLISRTEKLSFRKTLEQVFITWLPYLLILMFFVFWRSFVLASMASQNHPLTALLNPRVILSVAQNIFADGVLMFVSSWFNLIDPARFVIGPVRNLYLFAITLIGSGCFYFLSKPASQNAPEEDQLWEIFLAGILIFVAGMISAYSIGYIVHLKTVPWNSRFVLPAMAGLALMSSALIESIVTSPTRRHVVLAIVIGLLIGWHNQNTLNFKSAWEKQTRLYEQLIWRAPTITPGTAIIANEEILGYMGDYPTGFALNTMYEAKQATNVPLWFFAFSGNYSSGVDQATNGNELAARKATLTFHGKKQDAIIIVYEPEKRQCLWVLRPQDSDYKNLPERIKQAIQFLDHESIRPQEKTHRLYHTIVKENKDSWCYFYQKADLARQLGNWDQVLTLWDEAQSKGYRPDHGFEYIPFIEANGRRGKWEEAFLLSKMANKATKAMYFILCPTWERLMMETSASKEKEVFVEKAQDFLGCVP